MAQFKRFSKKTQNVKAVKTAMNVLSIHKYLVLLLCILLPLLYGCPMPTIRLIDPSTKLIPCDVSIKDILRVRIYVPPFKEQQHFARIFSKFENIIANLKDNLESLVMLRKSLVNSLLSGKLLLSKEAMS